MDEGLFSFKEFEGVRLKATYNMKIGKRNIEPGETIVKFDSILIAGLREAIKRITANGGFDNRAWVYWETTKEQEINFSQGVFSKEQLALLSNSRLVDIEENEPISITEREILESDENGSFSLSKEPNNELIFIYNKETGEKITDFSIQGKNITIADSFLDIIVDYTYDYISGANVIKIGQRLLDGYVELEGRTRIKDDKTGSVVTGIIKVPRLKLMSDLSIRLGTQASPVVGNFKALGVPVGSRGNTYVSEFYLLSDDIESDL